MKKQFITILITVFMMSNMHAQTTESYAFSKTVEGSMEQVIQKLKTSLEENKFGVITEIDMREKIVAKVENAKMSPYVILGVCNPGHAYKALQAEENIGVFLPCKIVVKEKNKNLVEIVSVNPSAVMKTIGNENLDEVADAVTSQLKAALEGVE